MQEKHVNKFKEIYKKHFGKELSREEALEKCLKLTRLMELLLEPANENGKFKEREETESKNTQKEEKSCHG